MSQLPPPSFCSASASVGARSAAKPARCLQTASSSAQKGRGPPFHVASEASPQRHCALHPGIEQESWLRHQGLGTPLSSGHPDLQQQHRSPTQQPTSPRQTRRGGRWRPASRRHPRRRSVALRRSGPQPERARWTLRCRRPLKQSAFVSVEVHVSSVGGFFFGKLSSTWLSTTRWAASGGNSGAGTGPRRYRERAKPRRTWLHFDVPCGQCSHQRAVKREEDFVEREHGRRQRGSQRTRWRPSRLCAVFSKSCFCFSASFSLSLRRLKSS